MTARKRKPAERRRAPVRRQALVLRVLSGTAGLVARYPRTLGGSVALFVVFSFVAANALWYQPRNHPHPFLATRDPQDPNAIAGYQPQRRAAPEDVTTFRIQRAPEVAPQEAATLDVAPQPATSAETSQTSVADVIGDDTPAAAPVVVPMPRPSGAVKPSAGGVDPVAAAIRAAELRPEPAARPSSPAAQPNNQQVNNQQASRQQASRAQPSPPADIPAAARASKARQAAEMKATPVSLGSEAQLVLQIQQGLSNIAYSDVSIDGVAGEQTRAAIRHFQKHYRLPVDGEPSEAVLSKLKSIGAL